MLQTPLAVAAAQAVAAAVVQTPLAVAAGLDASGRVAACAGPAAFWSPGAARAGRRGPSPVRESESATAQTS